MSRIGKKPIHIPDGVSLKIDDNQVSVSGPKGELSYTVHPRINFSQQDNQLFLTIADINNKKDKALWGTNRQMLANLIIGVTQGFTKDLEIKGVGYKAEVKGDNLVLNVGYSHAVEFKIPQSVTVKVEKNIIKLESIDKQLLGQTAASIRKIRKPEPYKGKGIKYVDEVILRKAGKQVKTGAEG